MKARRRWSHDGAIMALALLGGLPGLLLGLHGLAVGGYSARAALTLALLAVGCWLILALVLRERVLRPLQTLANVLGALREGDYSLRARGGWAGDDLGVAILEANALGAMLREQRTGALEAGAILRRVMDEIDVAVFAFDPWQRLQLVNRAGAALLGQPAERALGQSIGALRLGTCLEGEPVRTASLPLGSEGGRFQVRRSRFRQKGRVHDLLVVTDLRRALREEEREAWQRLVRVLGHEINNSLAPIQCLAESLQGLMQREPRPEGLAEDIQSGLRVIARRSEALGRFLASYAHLARLPPPRLGAVDVRTWLVRVIGLEARLAVTLVPGTDLTLGLRGDGDQLDQLLINLLRNAVDAALTTRGGVQLSYRRSGAWLEVRVEDEGPGLLDTGNLFVPFFTTKPGGTGIGLVLSRQIAEAHGGTLSVHNRPSGPGCVALLRLPLDGAARAEADLAAS